MLNWHIHTAIAETRIASVSCMHSVLVTSYPFVCDLFILKHPLSPHKLCEFVNSSKQRKKKNSGNKGEVVVPWH